MRKKYQGGLFFVFFLFPAFKAVSQNQFSDSSRIQASMQYVINLFDEEAGGNRHLFNGPEHRGYMRPATSHPYYLSEDIHTGNICYDGILYKNVPLMYDIVNDNVITMQYVKDSSVEYRSIFKIDLFRDRTDSFSFPGHSFIKIEADSNTGRMKRGFYEVLYNGKAKVVVRRTKVYVEEIRRDLERRYDSSSAYYIQKDGIYHLIKNKGAVLDVFKDKRREIAAFISKNKLKYRKQKEELIAGAARYYEQLTN